MRLVLTISTAVWAIAALVMLYFYPLNRKRAYEIRDALEARRGKV
jgi:Na+/melibiose symporter-like transporter